MTHVEALQQIKAIADAALGSAQPSPTPTPTPEPTPTPTPPPAESFGEPIGTRYTVQIAPDGTVTPFSQTVQTPYTLDFNMPSGPRLRLGATKGVPDAETGTCEISIDGGPWLPRGAGFNAPQGEDGAYVPFSPGFHRVRVRPTSKPMTRQVIEFKTVA